MSKIGTVSAALSAGSATQTSRPPRRSDRYACSNDCGDAASATATSAPPSAWIAATGSVGARR